MIDAVESALEGENRHEESFARKWDAIKKFIKPKDHLKAVKELADSFCSWENDLQYVTDNGDKEGDNT